MLVRALIVTLIFFSPLLGIGQLDQQIDSLKQRLTMDIHDTARAAIYVGLATLIPDEETWVMYNDKAFEFATKKLEEGAKDQDRIVYIKAKANSLANRGYYFDYQGDIEKAMDNYYEAIDLYKKVDDKEGIASAYSNLGLIFSDNGDWDEAEDLLNKALELKLEIGKKKDIAVTLINLGFAAEGQGDAEEGMRLYMRAAELAFIAEAWNHYATAVNNIGSAYHKQGDHRKALKYLREAYEYYNKVGDLDGMGWAMANMAENHLVLGQTDSANLNFRRAYELAAELGHPELLMVTALDMYELNKRQGEYDDALRFHEEYHVMKDCLANVDIQKEALKKKQAYDRKMDRLENKQKLEKERAIREQQDKRRQEQIIYISGGLFLVIVFAVIIFQRLRLTRRQKMIIEEQNKEIVDSINYAKRLQEAILPPTTELQKHLNDYFILYKPKDIVAGDFYWEEEIEDGVLIAAADCTGHGVPGAMVSVVCNNAMNRAVREFGLKHPGEILDKTRELVLEQFEKSQEEVKDGMDIALLKISGTKVEYAGANNPLWVVKAEGQSDKAEGDDHLGLTTSALPLLHEVKADKQPIGKTDNPKPFTNHSLDLNEGDTLYIFSDGYADQFGGAKGKKFKSGSFKKLLVSLADESMSEQHKRIDQAFEEWRGDLEQLDDVCVIGIKL